MITRFARRAYSIVEILVAFLILATMLGLIYGLLVNVRRGEAKLSRVERAVAHAEIALAHMSAELRSMLPPDPFADRMGYRILEGGRGLAFMRLEEARGALAAAPVTYELRPTGRHGNQLLYRNGVKLNGILLRDVTFSQQDLTEVDTADGNPVLRVSLTGIAEDADPATLGPTGIHTVELDVPVPATSPSAIRGLPAVARQLITDAIRFRGTISTGELAD